MSDEDERMDFAWMDERKGGFGRLEFIPSVVLYELGRLERDLSKVLVWKGLCHV